MDFWDVSRVLVCANNLIVVVKKALADDRLSTQEIVNDIMPQIIVLIKSIDPKVDTMKLEDGISMEALARAYAVMKNAPGGGLF